MKKSEIKSSIIKRVAQELKDGDVVNLGVGLPTLVLTYLPERMHVILQSENGITDAGVKPTPKEADSRYKTDTGGQLAQAIPFGCYIDPATSFGFIRGSHVNAAILGGLEVDKESSLFNWIIPSKEMPDIGGAMDLLVGVKEAVVVMEHTVKDSPKILRRRRLPYTAAHCITKITTEMCVINVTDKGLELVEINPEFTVEQVQAVIETTLIVFPDLKSMC